MQSRVSEYLLEWSEARDAKALAFLRESFEFVNYSPVDIDSLKMSLNCLEQVYSTVQFQLKNQPIVNQGTAAIEWEMQCSNGDSGTPLPPSLVLSGSDFIRLSNDTVQSIDLYFDPTPFAQILQHMNTSPARYKRSGISFDLSLKISQHVETLMQSERLYLQSELSLSKLAKLAGLHPNHVSQAINQQFNLSFTHWVSQYRVQAAKRLLEDPSHQQYSVLDIAFSVGFNSKSVFYSAFKQCCGITPNQFRKHSSA